MKKIVSAASVSGILTLLPAVAFAQFTGIESIILDVVLTINRVLVPAVFAIAFLIFIWGIFKFFILGGGDEAKRESGKQLMLWAIIGFLLMVSIWGIVNVLSSSLGFDEEEIKKIPNVPVSNP